MRSEVTSPIDISELTNHLSHDELRAHDDVADRSPIRLTGVVSIGDELRLRRNDAADPIDIEAGS